MQGAKAKFQPSWRFFAQYDNPVLPTALKS